MNSADGFATSEDEHGYRESLGKSLTRIDQSITAHSLLRDRFALRASLLSGTTLIAAAIVTFLAISSAQVKQYLGLPIENADLVTALFGFVVLLCSILELHLGWREKSARHSEAANALARLKLLIARELVSDLVLGKARYAEFQQAYENVNDLIARIPERHFLNVKSVHRKKVEMSQFLDKHPGAWIWLLRIKIWFRDNLQNGPGEK